MVLYTRHAGLGWTYPCDLWSVGCILVELCSVSFGFCFFDSYIKLDLDMEYLVRNC